MKNHSKIHVAIFRMNICRDLIAGIEAQLRHQQLKNEELLEQVLQAVYRSSICCPHRRPHAPVMVSFGPQLII